jgi:hypothetical protein
MSLATKFKLILISGTRARILCAGHAHRHDVQRIASGITDTSERESVVSPMRNVAQWPRGSRVIRLELFMTSHERPCRI